MTSIQLFGIGAGLLAIELVYFKIARKFGVVDHPNERTLHEGQVIRGGGAIFYAAAGLSFFITGQPDPIFLGCLTLVSVTGFLDDLVNVKVWIRFVAHVLAFSVLLYYWQFASLGYPVAVFILFVAVCGLNAYNFMDGINGITGGYSLLTCLTLYLINEQVFPFANRDFLAVMMLSLAVFNFFNFRRYAVCFAGDVGSTTIAFIIISLILLLIKMTGNFIFVLLLAVYGVDSLLTIVHRLARRENIFKAHRFHLFQMLVYHFKIPHLRMTLYYVGIQMLINIIVVACLRLPAWQQYWIGLGILVILGVSYVSLKAWVVKRFQLA